MELDTEATVLVISETDWSRLIGDTLLLEPYTGLWILRISTRSSRTSYSGSNIYIYIYEQQKTSLPLVVIAGIKRLQELVSYHQGELVGLGRQTAEHLS